MDIFDYLLSLYYGFVFASVISFANVFTSRCKKAFYEKSRKNISNKWKYILSGRSKCDHCNSSITFIYLIPVFGYLFSLRKCTKCKQNISISYFIEETIAFMYGFVFFYITKKYNVHYHILTIFMIFYFFICYFISSIDFTYFLIPTEAIFSIFILSIMEYFLIDNKIQFILWISIPITWFALLHLINYFMPGKLGLADIHLIFALCLATAFPGSLFLPTIASFIAIIYFFIRYRKEQWNTARLTKIPFGLFLCIAFILLKLIPSSYIF
ncbi:MAG: A24 family peptidase [Spirochaetia bacterium]|nr:A24 family peptidase [Spirochaetia bacterium]